MSNAWFLSPLTPESTQMLEREGIAVPPSLGPSALPTPDQVFATLRLFPEYHVAVRRRDRKEKGQAVYIELRRAGGVCAIDIHLLRVTADDHPVGTFVFDYYKGTEELVRIVSRMADLCGPLVLWHDSGGEKSILIHPGITFPAGPQHE